MRIRAKHYQTGERIDIVCEQGRIRTVEPAAALSAHKEAGWVAPALFDPQINGYLGHSFNSESLDSAAIINVANECRRHGLRAFCPTVITNSFDALSHAFGVLAEACASDRALAAAMPAFHLEGPYISPEDGPRGAHPRRHVRAPDWEEFCRLQQAASGRIRLITLAPELDGALGFIEKLVKNGVVVALGHTAASGERIRQAIAAGARLSTHLGNGAHAVLPRHDNYLWEQLAADDLWASIICDGQHLTPAVERCILRVKTPSRTILTCDAGSMAGLSPGRYRGWDQDLEVRPEGKIVLTGTSYLAGSHVLTDSCVNHVLSRGYAGLADTLDMAGARPRELLGLPPIRLEPGYPADLLLFDWNIGEKLLIREVFTSQCKTD